ncbi:MAG: hypothetical protein FWD40_09140 [Treponema sp.]|nr:hypothetical protein [Treponema sp.]
MKKLIVILLVMAMAAGAVFAQNLSLGGYFNSGIGVIITDGDEDPMIGAFGVDSEQLGYRFRLNGSYQNEERTSGFRFRIQSQNEVARRQNAYLSIPFAYGFMNYLDNKLSLSAGIVDDSAWQTADWWINDDVGEGLGTLIKLNSLIDGLNLGFGAYLVSQEGGGRNNQFSRTLNSGHFIDASDAKYVISGSYAMKDTFYLGGSFRTANDAGDDTINNNNAGRQETSQFIGDLRILAVKNLTAVVAISMDRLDDFDKTGLMTFSETFGYKVNDEINIGLNAVQFINNRDNTDMSMLFNVWGSYALDSIVPRLDITYLLGGDLHSNFHFRRGYVPTYNSKETVLSLRPSVRINLDSRTHFEIGNVTHLLNDDGKDSMLNLFYLDFRWSF